MYTFHLFESYTLKTQKTYTSVKVQFFSLTDLCLTFENTLINKKRKIYMLMKNKI